MTEIQALELFTAMISYAVILGVVLAIFLIVIKN